jgi:hypothetical protein
MYQVLRPDLNKPDHARDAAVRDWLRLLPQDVSRALESRCWYPTIALPQRRDASPCPAASMPATPPERNHPAKSRRTTDHARPIPLPGLRDGFFGRLLVVYFPGGSSLGPGAVGHPGPGNSRRRRRWRFLGHNDGYDYPDVGS